MGIVMCFLWEIFLKVFGSGQSDVRSGNSICYVLRGEREYGLRGTVQSILHEKTWIFLPSDSLLIARERCLELSNWMRVFKMFAFTTQQVTQTTGRKTV